MNKIAENSRYYACMVKLSNGSIVGRIHSAKSHKVILQGFITSYSQVEPLFLHYMGASNMGKISAAYESMVE